MIAADDAPGEGRVARRAWLAFPVLVLVLFALLVAFDLSGSSIALLVAKGQQAGLLAGQPRPIRSDELLIRTPIAISSVEQGFPASVWIGLAPTDQAAVAHRPFVAAAESGAGNADDAAEDDQQIGGEGGGPGEACEWACHGREMY